jgi:hypothetical protein
MSLRLALIQHKKGVRREHPRGKTPVESRLYIVLAKFLSLPEAWWAHPDLNQGPSGYEPVALTAELWAR